jgi:hypothetical protein
MNHIEEKRDSIRLDVRCTIYCKSLGTEESYKALCMTLSGSGISFTCNHPFDIGTDVEVTILPERTLVTPLDFFITIVRCQPSANGEFEIGARIILHHPTKKTAQLP